MCVAADVRFLADEPVRHNIMDLVGDLAMLGMRGNAGVPFGHVIAYKPNHFVQAMFVRAVYEQMEAGLMELVPFIVTDEEKAAIGEPDHGDDEEDDEEAEEVDAVYDGEGIKDGMDERNLEDDDISDEDAGNGKPDTLRPRPGQ